MMNVRSLIFHLLFFVSFCTYPQASTSFFTIRQCLDYAATGNSNIKVAKYNEQIATQQTNEVKGRVLPQANITGNWEDKLLVPLLIIPGGFGGASSNPSTAPSSTPSAAEAPKIRLGYQFNTTVIGEVTQSIIDPSLGVALKAAKQSTQLYRQQSQQVSEETAYNIANSYYQVIVLAKQKELLRSNLNRVSKTLEATNLQLQNGVAKQVDVNRLKVNASNLLSQIRQAELSLDQALNVLKFQMGMPLTQGLTLTDTALTEITEEVTLPSDMEPFLATRIDYKLLETNLKLQELDRSNTLRGYYPSLTGFANYGYNAQGPHFGFVKTSGNEWVDYNTSSIGLRLRIPVFDGFQRNSRSQQGKLKIIQLKERMNLNKQNIHLEISNAVTQYQNTQRRIESEKQNVELAQEVYKVTQLEYQEGVTSTINLVTSETSLREAQNTYTRTLLDLYTARLDLERAKGTLLTYLNTK